MKISKQIIAPIILPFFLISCTKAPVTGREQFIMVNPVEEIQLGIKSAKDILSKERVSKDQRLINMVNGVGKRLAEVASRDYPIAKDFRWEFFVIDNPKEENAFCLPGGKVFVYSGLFEYIANDAELASVLGHEIGHAIARHGAERVSRGILTQTGGEILQSVIAGKASPESSAMVMEAFGIGTQLGITLPHSRTQEYEADYIGLVLMAKAGYDPNSALTFWEKFSRSGETPPEYLSTHPAPINRIAKIKDLIPKVMPYYKQSDR